MCEYKINIAWHIFVENFLATIYQKWETTKILAVGIFVTDNSIPACVRKVCFSLLQMHTKLGICKNVFIVNTTTTDLVIVCTHCYCKRSKEKWQLQLPTLSHAQIFYIITSDCYAKRKWQLWCHCDVTMMSLWCHCDVTVMSLYSSYIVTCSNLLHYNYYYYYYYYYMCPSDGIHERLHDGHKMY